MQKYSIEPGLLQVFRFYAWLRVSAFLVTTIPFFVIFGSLNPMIYASWITVFIAINVFILLGYLYGHHLEHFLGNIYIPIGIGFATICLLLEQNLLYTERGFGQSQPFVYILLILVAWQYSFQTVIFYTISTTLVELAINMFTPFSINTIFVFHDAESFIIYGSMFARAVSFIIIGFTVHSLVEAKRAQHQALAEANQKLVRHAATLEQLTISRERNRLSRELHDTLAHTLSALAVQLDAVLSTWLDIPEKGKCTLEQMLTTTRNGLDETRRTLRALRASPLEELGLANAIRSLAEDVAARGNVSLELDVPENVDDFPPDVELGFYRVTQEALENTIQHAQATRISVSLIEKDKLLILTIIDNGKGIDRSRLSDERRLGIKGMQERAELMGATLKIDVPPGGGTVIILKMEQKI